MLLRPSQLRIAKDVVWLGMFVFAARAVGALKEIGVAAHYGVAPIVDAYAFLFNVINWPVTIWISVCISILVPALSVRAKGRGPVDEQFERELTGAMLLVTALVACVSYPIVLGVLNSGLSGLTGDAMREALAMALPMSMLVPLGLIVGVLSAWLMASGRHLGTLLEALPAVTILLAVYTAGTWLPKPLVWGTVAGFTVHVLALGFVMGAGKRLRSPRFTQKSEEWQRVWSGVTVLTVGQVAIGLTSVLDQLLAARLEPGSIATLNYANRVAGVLVGFGAVAVTRATLPIFSDIAQRQPRLVVDLSIRIGGLSFVVGSIVALLAWNEADWIVRVLFERGSFTPVDTHNVVVALRPLLLQIPFYFAGLVFVSGLLAMRYSVLVALIAGSNLIAKTVAVYAYSNNLEIEDISISTSIMYVFSSFCALICLGTIRRSTDHQSTPDKPSKS